MGKATIPHESAKATLDAAGLEQRQRYLSEQVEADAKGLVELEDARTQLAEREQHVREAENDYQLYEKKRGEAQMQDLLDKQKIADVAIVEKPVPSYVPVSPQVALNLLAGLLLALCAAGAAAFVAEFFPLRSPDFELRR